MLNALQERQLVINGPISAVIFITTRVKSETGTEVTKGHFITRNQKDRTSEVMAVNFILFI